MVIKHLDMLLDSVKMVAKDFPPSPFNTAYLYHQFLLFSTCRLYDVVKCGKNKQKKEQKAQLGVFLCSSMIYYDALLPNPIATWLNVLFCLT